MRKHKPKPNEYELAVRDLDSQMIQAKVALADKWQELRQVEATLAALQQQYVDAVVALGKSRGIDLDDKSQAWHFDGTSMTFTKRSE